MTFGTWLRTAREDEKDRGVDHYALACDAVRLTPYVRDHLARAAQGIEALYTQLPAAPVPESAQRAHWENGREAYIVRLREVLEHLAAALNAVGCTDRQLATYGHLPEVTPPVDFGLAEEEEAEDVDPEETITVSVPDTCPADTTEKTD